MNKTTPSTHQSARSELTIFLAILLGLTSALSLVTLVLKQTVLNYDLHMHIIQEQQIDQKVASILPGVLFDQLTGNAAPAVTALLSDPSTGIATNLIPEDWVTASLQLGVKSFINSLETGASKFSILLDLTPIKQKILTTSAALSSQVIDHMPACTAQQLLNFAGSALTGKTTSLPFCKPGEPFTRLITPLVGGWISGIAAQMPSAFEVPLFSVPSGDNAAPFFRALRLIHLIIPFRKIAPLVSLLLLLIIIGLNHKRLSYGIHWIGISFLITAASLLIVTWGTMGFPADPGLAAGNATPLLQQLNQMAIGYINAMLASIRIMMIKSTALFGGSGILLLLAARKDWFVWQVHSPR